VETSNLVETWQWTRVTGGAKVKVTGNENVKIVFRTCIRQKWIDLRQTKTKMIVSPFCTYRGLHFTSGNAAFLWYLSEIIREDHTSQRPSGRVPFCLATTKKQWDRQ